MTLTQLIEANNQALLASGNVQQVVNESLDAVLHLLNQNGCLLHKYGSREQGLRWLTIACHLGPEKAVAWSNLSVMLLAEGKFDEALKCSEKAVSIEPPFFQPWYNYGILLAELHRWKEAEEAYLRSIELKDDSQTHFNMGCVLYQQGRVKEALEKLEYRLKKEGLDNARNRYASRDWDGKEDLNGKTVLVISEQGIGDSIMFSRYLPDLVATGAKVILEVQEPARTLFEGFNLPVYGRDVEWKDEKAPPDHDLLVCFASLPYFFDPELKQRHGSYIEEERRISYLFANSGLHIGICWAGNQKYPNDRMRSCPLKYFSALQMDGVNLYNLQKGEMKRPQGDLLEGADVHMIDCEGYTDDFLDSAGVINRLDLIITVDTAVAHLAAAMGKEVWLLLSSTHDWRWLHGQERTHWYPSMRCFFQKKRDDWEELLGRVGQELKLRRDERLPSPSDI